MNMFVSPCSSIYIYIYIYSKSPQKRIGFNIENHHYSIFFEHMWIFIYIYICSYMYKYIDSMHSHICIYNKLLEPEAMIFP